MLQLKRRKLEIDDLVSRKDREELRNICCIMCNSIPEPAYKDSCGHMYCQSCILTLKQCPVNKIELELKKDEKFDAEINEKVVNCINDCSWKDMKRKLDNHLDADCPGCLHQKAQTEFDKKSITCANLQCQLKKQADIDELLGLTGDERKKVLESLVLKVTDCYERGQISLGAYKKFTKPITRTEVIYK
jgi:hypothetical protein